MTGSACIRGTCCLAEHDYVGDVPKPQNGTAEICVCDGTAERRGCGGRWMGRGGGGGGGGGQGNESNKNIQDDKDLKQE